MKIAKHLLALFALALGPAAAAERFVSPEAMARYELCQSIVLRLEGAWKMDVNLTSVLAPSGLHPMHFSMNFHQEPLVIQLAVTADARMASLPIFSGGIVNADGQLHPYLLVDRHDQIELMIFHGGSSTSFAWAEVYALNLVATDAGPRLLLGGTSVRSAELAYERKDEQLKAVVKPVDEKK